MSPLGGVERRRGAAPAQGCATPPSKYLMDCAPNVMWGRWLGPRRIAAARWDPPPCTGCDHRPHITPPGEAVRVGGRESLIRHSVHAAPSLLPVELYAI